MFKRQHYEKKTPGNENDAATLSSRVRSLHLGIAREYLGHEISLSLVDFRFTVAIWAR